MQRERKNVTAHGLTPRDVFLITVLLFSSCVKHPDKFYKTSDTKKNTNEELWSVCVESTVNLDNSTSSTLVNRKKIYVTRLNNINFSEKTTYTRQKFVSNSSFHDSDLTKKAYAIYGILGPHDLYPLISIKIKSDEKVVIIVITPNALINIDRNGCWHSNEISEETYELLKALIINPSAKHTTTTMQDR